MKGGREEGRKKEGKQGERERQLGRERQWKISQEGNEERRKGERKQGGRQVGRERKKEMKREGREKESREGEGM